MLHFELDFTINKEQEIIKKAAIDLHKYMNNSGQKNHGYDTGIFYVDKYFSPQLFKKVIDAVENQGAYFVLSVKEALQVENLEWLSWRTLDGGLIVGDIAKWFVSQSSSQNPIARCITSSCW